MVDVALETSDFTDVLLFPPLTATDSQKRPAHVPQPIVMSMVDASVNLSCISPGQPLRLCLWERTSTNGNRDVEIVDEGL